MFVFQEPMKGMTMMNVDRRGFLLGSTAMAAMAAMPSLAADPSKSIRLAAQMYSVRGIIKDKHGFLAMLRLMKDFGYSGVEFAGTWCDADEIKKTLADLGLVCAGAHCGLAHCRADTMAKTCELNLTYGNSFLVMPFAQPPKDCTDLKGWWKKLGADLSAGAEVAKRHGCTLAYHNHGHEFTQKIDGVPIWDLIFTDASDALKIQFDIGHLVGAGESAAKWFSRYPDRVVTIHAKNVCVPDAKLRPEAGQRGIDWPEVFELTQRNATQWYIVEAEPRPCDTQKMKYGADFFRKNAPFIG